MDHDLAPWAHVLLNALVAMGMLAIVPLGLRLSVGLPRWWFAAALPGAVSLWLPRGWLSVTFAILYALGTTALIWLVPRVLTIANLAIGTACLCLSVASYSLVAERAGYKMMGFDVDLLALTVAHFHYAGFAAALIAGLVAAIAPHPWSKAAALSVPAGTAVVFAGYYLNDTVELAGALILSAGMWIVGWLLWRRMRILLPALLLAVSMPLALGWALGHVLAVPHLSVNWMVATHGLLNAAGFALCTLLALEAITRRS